MQTDPEHQTFFALISQERESEHAANPESNL